LLTFTFHPRLIVLPNLYSKMNTNSRFYIDPSRNSNQRTISYQIYAGK
jgi:hypothetical protein